MHIHKYTQSHNPFIITIIIITTIHQRFSVTPLTDIRVSDD